jgi:predicted nuclease of predicted toxin-antitoxin system
VALKFYFDTHIAKASALQLRAKWVTVIRCEEVGMAEGSDEQHLRYATDEGCVMMSQDEDFTALAARWHKNGRHHGGIMKVSTQYSGEAQISHILQQLMFYVEAEQAGAVDYATEIADHVIFL